MLSSIPLTTILRKALLCGAMSLATLLPSSLYAQADTLADADASFALARTKAFSGQRQEGRELAQRLAARYPGYLDIRTFIGRTWAWDGDYSAARKEFAQVMAADAKTLDNYIAWADAERWADEPAKALAVVEKGLGLFREDTALLYRQARLLSITGKMAEAKTTAQKILRRHPNHGAAYILLQELRSQLLDNEVAVGYSYEQFSKYFTPAHFGFVQASRTTPLGSVTARVNYAQRFGKQTTQQEVELYPRLFRGMYGYLNYGYSAGALFPRHRYGAEIFTSLPYSFEASAGIRHLSFSENSRISIYTGSVGYYVGNYWLSLRSYVTPDSSATSVSAAFTVRRYLKGPEHYFSFRVGAGFSPELLNTQTASGVVSKAFYGLQSQTVNLAYQQPLSRRWTASGNITFGRQETLFDIGNYANNLATTVSLRYRYR